LNMLEWHVRVGAIQAGAPVTIILEGVTSSCVVDQAISLLPDSPLTPVPFLDALETNPSAAGVLLVSDGHELAMALEQPSVSTVYLGKQDGLVSTAGWAAYHRAVC
jgi:hypothetical protein